MKRHTKGKIRSLIDVEENDGINKSLARLHKRFEYLKSKLKATSEPSRHMRYIQFHINRLEKI